MARLNKTVKSDPVFTFEGARIRKITPLQEFKRTLLTCMLWEPTFYESANSVAKRLKDLVSKLDHVEVANLAIEARNKFYLRHAPLYVVRCLAAQSGKWSGAGKQVERALASIIQRPDELGEYLAMYWRDNKEAPLSAASKRGLAKAFKKFNEYQLAKYNRDTEYKLRDVLRLVHPKPDNSDQANLWKRLIKDELATPDTWEVALSGGADKRKTFERLLTEKKLGGLAFLRNLRNMIEAKVDNDLIRECLTTRDFDKVLPFRFVAAARYAPRFEPELETAMFKCLEGAPKLSGTTALIVDTSPSMWGAKVSANSDMDRFDAAAALAILLREICSDVHVWAFNDRAHEIPARRGFALRDALANTRAGYSCGGLAVEAANKRGYDRIIVLTDGQWHVMGAPQDRWGHWTMGDATKVSPAPLTNKAYMINVASYSNGVGYDHKWETISGWSENIIAYIQALEQEAW